MSPHTAASYATEMQTRTRKERNFSQAEADLPRFSQYSAVELLDPAMAKLKTSKKLADLLAMLGPYNPRPLPVTDKDEVWLLDNIAFRGQNGNWQAEFIAAVFAQHPSCRVIDVVSELADKLGLSDGERDEATIEERLMPFLMDVQPGKVVKASFGGHARLQLGPGGRNGISSETKPLPRAHAGDVVSTAAEVPRGTTGILQMKTMYADPDGWAVISDIDDTIKITQTSDPIGILRSTFVSPPTPVAGMPELYAYIREILTPRSPFFYLSASSYNLYPFLRDFREQFYPFGQLIMRDSSWMSIPGLLANLTMHTEEYKVDRMRKIQSWLPRKKVICIGDSTQSDPEAYGEICRAFPSWVRLVLIRKVTDIASVGIQAKNEPERFEKAFEGVPRSVWHVFEDPAECRKIIEGAILA